MKAFILGTGAALALLVMFFVPGAMRESSDIFSVTLFSQEEKVVEPFTYVVVGDVMMGRHVRKLMRTHGSNYPFVHARDIFSEADAVVANLEGPITELDGDPANMMRFSFDPAAAAALANAGVTHVSLANNHASDQGREGRADTRTHVGASGIVPFGYPSTLSVGAVTHLLSEEHDIAFIGLDATLAPLDLPKVTREIMSFGTSTHLTVFIHWGDEYQLVHNATQEDIAHALVDAGVDAIIGSHPHVVQDIELYNGVPIFYSLGNFIFDQYWNADVETGLGLRVTHREDEQIYELIPIDGNHSQPKLMEESEQQAFFNALADRSSPDVAEMVRRGLIQGNTSASRTH